MYKPEAKKNLISTKRKKVTKTEMMKSEVLDHLYFFAKAVIASVDGIFMIMTIYDFKIILKNFALCEQS